MFRPLKRTVRRLHLRFLLLRPGNPNPNGFYITVLSTSILFALSKPWQAHQKHTTYCNNGATGGVPGNSMLMVDLAGVEPASRTHFYLLHTAITYIIQQFWTVVNLRNVWLPRVPRTLMDLTSTQTTTWLYCQRQCIYGTGTAGTSDEPGFLTTQSVIGTGIELIQFPAKPKSSNNA